jgi:hypothetical protein
VKVGVSFQLRFEEYRLANRLLSRRRVSLWYAVAGFVVLGIALLALGPHDHVLDVMSLSAAAVYAVLLTFGVRAQLKNRFTIPSLAWVSPASAWEGNASLTRSREAAQITALSVLPGTVIASAWASNGGGGH